MKTNMRKFKISWDEVVEKDVEVEFIKWCGVFYAEDSDTFFRGCLKFDTEKQVLENCVSTFDRFVGAIPIKVKHTTTEKVIERKEKILYDPNGKGCGSKCSTDLSCDDCIYKEDIMLCVTTNGRSNIDIEKVK